MAQSEMKRGVEFVVNVENCVDDKEEDGDQSNEEFTGSLTEQELQRIKEELRLIDDDGDDNHCSSDSEAYGSTPFDSPLTEAERKLLDEFTLGTTSSFPRSPSTSRSASLAEVADSLIKDLEKYTATHTLEYNNNYDSDQSDKDDLDDYTQNRNRGKESRNDSDLGSSLSMASGVDGLEKLVEELALRTDSKSIKNCNSDTSTLSMDLQEIQNGSEVVDELKSLGSTPDNNAKSVVKEKKSDAAQVDHSLEMDVDFSAISSRSSSIQSGSIPASVDSGLPVNDASTGQHRYFVVVAIDFGTTFSGYAFAFTRDPESIHIMRRWEGGDPGVSNQKTPTTLLLRPDETFHSFGFGARDFYHDLEPDEARKWLYFEKFKMALHTKKNLNKNVEIKAANGKPIKAVTVFAHALKFFKDHVIEELTDQSATQILEEDIQWVITVPAIWRAPAKQFMRTAAYEAGLATSNEPDRILIALEPEAASIFCRKLRLRDCVWQESKRRSTISSSTDEQIEEEFQDKTRYMVVDCGGGTVDLTVYELNTKAGTLEELHKGTGGACGATGVDQEFENLLKKIFGKEFIDQFKSKRPAGWVDLMIAFEAKKRTASPNKANPLNISLPFVFIDYYKKHKSSTVESAVKKFGSSKIKWSSQGMLRVAPETMNELFAPVLKQIIQHIRVLLSTQSVSDIAYLFLVGGFAESPLLQTAVRDAFGSQMRIIIPQDVGLTILKGAVLFGLDPTVVRVRRAAMTYGVGVLNRFVPGKHPKSKLVKKNGIEWCTDILDKYVIVDQAVNLGDKVTRSYAPAKPGQNYTIITIYSSDEEHVTFVTDSGVKKCGQLRIEMPDMKNNDPIKPREIQASMEFGNTEIKVSAVDVLSGLDARASIDFLSN